MCREFFINRIHSILTIIFSLSKHHKNTCILTNEANLHCWQFNERWRSLFCLLHSLHLLHSLFKALPFNERAVGFTAFSQRLEPCLYCNFRYKSSASWVKSRIFAAAIGSIRIEWKRESGESPEQSRCCEQPSAHANTKPLTIFREGVCMMGCKSEDLPLQHVPIRTRGRRIDEI